VDGVSVGAAANAATEELAAQAGRTRVEVLSVETAFLRIYQLECP
jgi:hypothetical protein